MKKAVVNQKRIDISEIQRLIVKGDTIDSIAFVVPRYYNGVDLSDYNIYLKYENDLGVGENLLLTQDKVTDKAVTLIWQVGGGFSQDRGQHKIQLWCSQVVNNETIMKWQTFPAQIEVINTLDPTPIVLATPEVLEQYLSYYQALEIFYEIVESNDEIKVGFRKGPGGEWEYTGNLRAKAPYIGENGHWFHWDSGTSSYVDSGYLATGDPINIRDGSKIKMWQGTVAQYNALTPEEQKAGGIIHFIEEYEGV